MKWIFYLSVFLVVLGFVCAKTLPDKEAHVRAVSAAVISEIEKGNVLPGIADTKLSDMATDEAFVDECLANMLVIESYGVVTIGKIRWMNNEYVVSLGILGKVFTFADAKTAKDYVSSFEDKITDKIGD